MNQHHDRLVSRHKYEGMMHKICNHDSMQKGKKIEKYAIQFMLDQARNGGKVMLFLTDAWIDFKYLSMTYCLECIFLKANHLEIGLNLFFY